jgi:hypothetical protein
MVSTLVLPFLECPQSLKSVMFSDKTVTCNETYITVTKCNSGACNAGKRNFKCEDREACNVMLWRGGRSGAKENILLQALE